MATVAEGEVAIEWRWKKLGGKGGRRRVLSG
jgi:hypothetical protein